MKRINNIGNGENISWRNINHPAGAAKAGSVMAMAMWHQ
jgi:hypothetical protein